MGGVTVHSVEPDVATRRRSRSSVPPGYVFVAWASSGESVFMSGGQRFERRTFVEYRLGEGRATKLPIDVGDFYGMAAS